MRHPGTAQKVAKPLLSYTAGPYYTRPALTTHEAALTTHKSSAYYTLRPARVLPQHQRVCNVLPQRRRRRPTAAHEDQRLRRLILEYLGVHAAPPLQRGETRPVIAPQKAALLFRQRLQPDTASSA